MTDRLSQLAARCGRARDIHHRGTQPAPLDAPRQRSHRHCSRRSANWIQESYHLARKTGHGEKRLRRVKQEPLRR